MKKLFLCLLLLAGCAKKEDIKMPVVATAAVSSITTNTAVCGGNVTSDGGGAVTARGVCWSTGQTPIISDNKTSDGAGVGNFSSNLSGLNPNTKYYVRAYSTNKTGTGYGSAVMFTTSVHEFTERPQAAIPGGMVLIPAGSFRMGNITNNSSGGDDEKPVHKVTITRPFLMGKTEVTQAQWKAIMRSNPSDFKGDKLPVENIGWEDAVAFCNKLSKEEKLNACYSGSGAKTRCDFRANGYRLPTEAEWEYACRAGTKTDFHTGNMTSETGNDPALNIAGWYDGNSGGKTHKTGLKKPNAFGLYDMHGNVYEWCWDWYDASYYKSGAITDPKGPSTGTLRVLRGGSWGGSSTIYCRSAYRHHLTDPNYRSYSRGFRYVRTY